MVFMGISMFGFQIDKEGSTDERDTESADVHSDSEEGQSAHNGGDHP